MKHLTALSSRDLAKYCAFALVLLAPGSFVVLPVLWAARFLAAHGPRQ